MVGEPGCNQRQKQVGTGSQTILPGASGKVVDVMAELHAKERGVTSSMYSRGGNKSIFTQDCEFGSMKKKVCNLGEMLLILSHHASSHADQRNKVADGSQAESGAHPGRGVTRLSIVSPDVLTHSPTVGVKVCPLTKINHIDLKWAIDERVGHESADRRVWGV